MKVRWEEWYIGVLGTTNLGETVEEEIKRRLRVTRRAERPRELRGLKAEGVENSRRAAYNAMEFMYPLNVGGLLEFTESRLRRIV